MTTKEWIEKARESRALLTGFISEWHPARPSTKGVFEVMPITAGAAEMTCETVRQKVAQEEKDLALPSIRFQNALDDSGFDELYGLLNSAWFGVPESTSCWHIPGFKQAVELLEDPPDDQGPGEDYPVTEGSFLD